MTNPTGMRVIGLDLSLTSTGISDLARTDAIQPGHLRGEARMDYITSEIFEWIGPSTQLAVIEGASFNSLGPGHDEMAGLRWVIRQALWRVVPIAVVPPAALKKATTGDGRASKEAMADLVRIRHGRDFSDVKVGRGRYDMVDAYALAVMGRNFLAGAGYPAVDWPDLPTTLPKGIAS